jgi:precorrin-2 dehydrogenase/sirohydrochlorin ferrochelatase
MAAPVYFPIYLDLRGRKAVVVGGGGNGEKKVAGLLPTGANIIVISEEVEPSVAALVSEGKVTQLRRGYRDGDLEDAFVVVVADTSNEAINQAVHDDAARRNIVCNVEDVTHLCTYIYPAVIRRGDVTVAVSTGGASPALARKFREMLSGTSPVTNRHPAMEFADLAGILSDTRQELRSRGISLTLDHFQACITDELVDLVQSGKEAEARDILMADLLKGTDCDCQSGTCKMWMEMASVQASSA